MKEGSFTFISKNKEKWAIFQYFEPWDWIIGYSVDVDVKYKEIEQYKNKFLITVSIILFVISILIILTVKYTLLPIEKLIVASKRIAKGDLKSDIKINGSYELTQLSNSFSIMRDKIRTNIEELENANNQLEQKVDARTKDLKNTIADLEKMQEQLVESEKIASLGVLVAGVAHEINTPIGIGVTGISHFELISKELMKKYNDNNLSEEEFKEFIKVSNELASSVTTNLRRAADIIRSFKKVAVDRASEEKREFNVKEYLEEILISLRNITKKTKHQYIIDCPKKLVINSYPGLFSQVITNFIMNSIIHAFKDNEAGKIEIKINQENSELNIQYKDNGCGISEENTKKIFNPFFTTNRKNGGSGLGVHNIIISQLKGTIKVESENGNGTKFIIKIPL
jgi:C4-dicarboxylate-specific signal transduction histidine kinase